jgi:hypothetical protein
MSEMVERVAIAMYDAEGFQRAIYKSGAEGWPHDREDVRDRYRKIARAAIAAMREPTNEMLDASGEVDEGWGRNHAIWRAMIDKALE